MKSLFGVNFYSSRLSLILMALFFVLVFGADVSANEIKDAVIKINTQMYNTISMIVSAIAFIIGVWQLVEGWMQKQIQSKLLTLIGIGVFIIVLRGAPTLYNALTRVEQKDFIIESGGAGAGELLGD